MGLGTGSQMGLGTWCLEPPCFIAAEHSAAVRLEGRSWLSAPVAYSIARYLPRDDA
tara:strand:+ start:185 stop:352 length:168 start_codon:yes stop_codon:yes gene_type:complete